jgi:hypothetical protein
MTIRDPRDADVHAAVAGEDAAEKDRIRMSRQRKRPPMNSQTFRTLGGTWTVTIALTPAFRKLPTNDPIKMTRMTIVLAGVQGVAVVAGAAVGATATQAEPKEISRTTPLVNHPLKAMSLTNSQSPGHHAGVVVMAQIAGIREKSGRSWATFQRGMMQ